MVRFLKQLAYGLFYLSVFTVVAGGVYYVFLPDPTCSDQKQNQGEEGVDCSGPCASCDLKGLEVKYEEPHVFSGGAFKSTVAVHITNPSERYGVKRFNYTLDVFSRFGTRLNTIYGDSSLSPGENKYIVAPGLDLDARDIGRVVINIGDVNWEPSETLPQRLVMIKDVRTRTVGDVVEVTGGFMNNSSAGLRSIKLTALLFNKEAELIHASTTHVDVASAFQTVPFTIYLPALTEILKRIDYTKTQVFYEIVED